MPVPIAIRLAIRQWRARPLRPVLCSIAIAAAVTLIVCVGVGMDSLRYTLATAIGQALGVAEVHVRMAQYGTRVTEPLLQKVRALPEVDFAAGRLHAFAWLTKGDDHLLYDVLGIDLTYDEQLRPKTFEQGHTFSQNPAVAAGEILVDTGVAKKLALKVGEMVSYTSGDEKPRPLKIVGIVKRPDLDVLTKHTIYVPLEVLQKDAGVGREYDVIDVKLKQSAGVEDFDAYAKTLGAKLGPSVEVQPGTSSKAKLGEFTKTLRLMLLILSATAGFCSALIIATTLSVGIQERVRQFGQLRCIGASRGQLAAFLLGDAAVMLFFGEILGVLLGMALSVGMVMAFPQFFSAYRISWLTAAIAVFCGCLATMLGAMIPIWQVSRVPPMAAVTAVGRPPRRSRIWLAGGLGAACLIAQAGMWNLIPSREMRFYTYVCLGIPLIFVGWCLLAPVLLVLFEGIGARALGRVFGVQASLLRHTWTRTPWRASAMIAALMIGVTLFVTVRARGASLLASWTMPDRIPDVIIKKPIGGFSESGLKALRARRPQISSVAAFDYFGVHLTDKPFQLGALLGEGESMFIAVDVNAFSKMLELEFIQGDRATAIKQMADGRHVIVSKEYYNVRKLGVGDKISIRDAEGKPVEFTIAAVVTSTGVDMVQNFFDLRSSFSEKAISSVLGTLDDAHKYFKLGDPSMLLIDVDAATRQPAAMAKFREDLTADGLLAFSSVELKASLTSIISRVINGLSVIGIGALCVASLGVANMVIASIHARRFEFGVLRAIGAGRGQLVRLVLAEVTLIGVVAGGLGACAGLHFAFMATRIDYLLVGFPMVFLAKNVWAAAWIGVLEAGLAMTLTTLLAWLASIVPAIRGAFSAQQTLLASGRT